MSRRYRFENCAVAPQRKYSDQGVDIEIEVRSQFTHQTWAKTRAEAHATSLTPATARLDYIDFSAPAFVIRSRSCSASAAILAEASSDTISCSPLA